MVLIFSNWVQPSPASPGDGGIQRLPVIEKQDIRFDALSVGGKPFQKRVFALAQDNYGFLWLGTDDGMYRYDGYSLRQYSHDPGNPRSLTHLSRHRHTHNTPQGITIMKPTIHNGICL